MVMQVVHRTLS